MKNRKANRADIDKIVKLHLIAFEGYFLSLLGSRFLKHFYKSFLETDKATLIVSERNMDVLGFVAVVFEPEFFFKDLKKRKGFMLFVSALPSLLKRPNLVIRKLIHGFFYRGGNFIKPENAALISSIGVNPSSKGLGVGRSLMKSAEGSATQKNKDNIYLTTDKYKNERVLCFYESNGYSVAKEFKQAGERVMLVLTKVLKKNEANDD